MQIRLPGTEELPAPASPEQQELLQTVWNVFASTSEWPTFDWVDRKLDRQEIDTVAALAQLPDGLMRGLPDPSRPVPQDDAVLALTIAGVARCNGSSDVVLLFLALIRVLAETERKWQAGPGGEKPTLSECTAIRRLNLMPIEDHTTLLLQARTLAQFEPGIEGHHIASGGEWTLKVGRSIRPFREVGDIGAYWCTREALRTPTPVSPANCGGGSPDVLPIVRSGSPYISDELIAALGTTTTKYKLDKLTALARELNENYSAGHPYASQMLLRAILDHVPPAFEQKTFDNVVANVSWSRTDKAHVKKLRDARASADDVLHRQVRQSPSHFNMDDMPPRAAINALLQALMDRLSGVEQ
ncbi:MULTISPECIES: hypothetical protein [unclassified Streptomyces]|uniref:hypothetical protein n=1 Tax=unclassified Streptomyces TaxID=2593676 RepID=UPI000B41EEAE|nr:MULTISPECIES: hypothetical protein [unclassified Streptomyces]OWA26054.1 hypothetical protein B9W61_03180 [Streptomyces sp. CS057]